MSRTRKYNDKYRNEDANRRRGKQRRLSVRGVRRTDPDLRRMGKALVAFTLAEAEAQAENRRSESRTDAAEIETTRAEESA